MSNNEKNDISNVETQPSPATTEEKTPGKRGRKPLISDADFIKLWNSSPSLAAVVERSASKGFGSYNKNYFSMRAVSLRKQGASIKQFKRGRRAVKPVLLEE